MKRTAITGLLAITAVGMAHVSVASAASFTVTTTANGGAGSLRQAILDADATPATDTIRFAVPGAGGHVIKVTSPLPPLAHEIVDGRTQPGYAGAPLIQLRNRTGDPGATGLDLATGSATVLGLSVTGFGTGIQLRDGDGNTVAGNWVGLNLKGNADGNVVGISISAASSENTIGGARAKDRNVISGNVQGVAITGALAENNTVVGNRIGTDAGGSRPRPNSYGVLIQSGATANLIGGTSPATRNLISGNSISGVTIDGSDTADNTVEGNYIGTKHGGVNALGNAVGVQVSGGATGTVIGGTAAGQGNLISGNQGTGLVIRSTDTSNTTVRGNLIGTTASGADALGNATGVVLDDGAAGNTIGGIASGARNVISGNTNFGVYMDGAATTGNVVLGNLIGTDGAGTAAVGNTTGVYIEGGANANLIGGGAAGAGNVLSGNTFGLELHGFGTSGNQVAGNLIGLDATGTAALANSTGVLLETSGAGNTVGGTASGERNVISGNSNAGVWMSGATENNQVLGNRIGTDTGGTTAVGNLRGVDIGEGSTGNTVGGTSAAERNVVSGNAEGIDVHGTGTSTNTVSGNYVGTDPTGTVAVANGTGIAVFGGAESNTVGGTASGSGNLVSGNDGAGVMIFDDGTGANTVAGNVIGVDSAGTAALPNQFGVEILGGSGNTIGGTATGSGNTIMFNTAAGVSVNGTVTPTTGISILGNSIDTNGGLGIDLIDANDDQTAPEVDAVSTSTTTTVDGSLDSIASTDFRIELFASPACDDSGAGEGQTFLGAVTVTADSSGHATFSDSVAAQASGRQITATATNQTTGDTSEFSACFGTP